MRRERKILLVLTLAFFPFLSPIIFKSWYVEHIYSKAEFLDWTFLLYFWGSALFFPLVASFIVAIWCAPVCIWFLGLRESWKKGTKPNSTEGEGRDPN